MSKEFESEQCLSGKMIYRRFDNDGALVFEVHTYENEIAIQYAFEGPKKIAETYSAKGRTVSRKTYDKARTAYPDMPASDPSVEDFGTLLASEVRRQQRQKKLEAEERLRNSAESRFPRPESTNWLRVITEDDAHLVIFASRDWKLLSRERLLPSGREWLDQFGFLGGDTVPPGGVVAQGLEVGFEVERNTAELLRISQALLKEVETYVPPEVAPFQNSFRPRPKPKKPKPYSWATVLPPLIQFLSTVKQDRVKVFNHHR